jgi:hypothetical protein
LLIDWPVSGVLPERSGYSQVDPSLYQCARNLLTTGCGLPDRVIARSIVVDAAFQGFGRILGKVRKNRVPDTAWNAKIQLTASDRNLTRVRDLD